MFRRIFLTLIVLVLLPILLLLTAYFFHHRAEIGRGLRAGMEDQLIYADSILVNVIEEKKNAIRSWGRVGLPKICLEYDRPEALTAYFDELRQIDDSFGHIVAFRPNAVVFASDSASLPTREHFVLPARVRGDDVTTNLVQISQVDYLVFTIPVRGDDNETLGYLSGYIHWDTVAGARSTSTVMVGSSLLTVPARHAYFDAQDQLLGNVRSPSIRDKPRKSSTTGVWMAGATTVDGASVIGCHEIGNIVSAGVISHCLSVQRTAFDQPLIYLRNIALLIGAILTTMVIGISLRITRKILAPFRRIALVLSHHLQLRRLEFRGTQQHSDDLDGMQDTIVQLVNDLVCAERELSEHAKLVAVGKIAQHVAHDIRSPLSSMQVAVRGLGALSWAGEQGEQFLTPEFPEEVPHPGVIGRGDEQRIPAIKVGRA